MRSASGRVEALSGFRNEIAGRSYPGATETAGIAQAELEDFRQRLTATRD